MHRGDRRMPRQQSRHRHGIGAVPVHPQRQGLQAAQQQRRVLRGQHRAGHVLQPLQADALGDLRIGGHRHAGGHVAMPADVLGRRMHHHVRAQRQRPLQVGRAIGVVDHHQRAGGLRAGGDLGDVDQPHVRVGRRLEVHQLGPARHRRVHCGQVGHVDVGHAHAEFADAVVQEGVGAAVHGLVDHDLVARPQQRPQGGGDRAHAGAERHGGRAALQFGHARFQQRQRRVGDAGVHVARRLAGETAAALLRRGEGEGGGHVHRRHQRAVVVLRPVAVVDGGGGETGHGGDPVVDGTSVCLAMRKRFAKCASCSHIQGKLFQYLLTSGH